MISNVVEELRPIGGATERLVGELTALVTTLVVEGAEEVRAKGLRDPREKV
jgi:hypothetical protein